VINGFATMEEAEAMEKKDGVLLVRPATSLQLHTTYSPSFLGLHQGVGFWKKANLGKGVIIGVIDSGIAPNHPSLSDKGMPPPPTKWKGKCEFEGMACNNKLIGGRTFHSSSRHTNSKAVHSMQPLDDERHGTQLLTMAWMFFRSQSVEEAPLNLSSMI
jgi:subtilisin family serine protease